MREELEQDLKYFIAEVSVFMKFLSEFSNDHLNDSLGVDHFTLSTLVYDFYKKNKNKYNASQLVYQFLKQITKGDKDVIKTYNAFRKLKESGDITIPNY